MKPISHLGWITLVFLIVLQSTEPRLLAETCAADLDGDGAVGEIDWEILLAGIGTTDLGPSNYARLDLNGNGYVCGADLRMLLDNWGPCLRCSADLTNDGRVDATDRFALEAAYGRNCRANLGRFGSVGEWDLAILQLSRDDLAETPHQDADPRADLNDDGIIDMRDEAILIGELGLDCHPDLNADGSIDHRDLWVLFTAWGLCPTGPDPTSSDRGTDDKNIMPQQCDPKG